MRFQPLCLMVKSCGKNNLDKEKIMAVESIGATGQLDNSSNLNRAGLGQDDFLKILLAQLTYQDPLKPMDNQEFIAQMAQFSSLEQSQQSNTNLETLLTIQSANQSFSLLNKSVEVVTNSGSEVGDVTSIRFENGNPLLTVLKASGEIITDVSLSNIRIVR